MLRKGYGSSISPSGLRYLAQGKLVQPISKAIAAMMRIASLFFLATLALPLHAGSTLAPAKIYAQKLVNQTVTKYPDLLVVAMHVTPPQGTQNEIIASNIGRIGKRADAEDLKVITTGEMLAKVNQRGDRFEVELPLHDGSSNPIGALAIVFPYKAGDDASQFVKRAQIIRDELAKQIPQVARLMEPVAVTR